MHHFLIPIKDNALFYAPLHYYSAYVNGAAAQCLRDGGNEALYQVFGESGSELRARVDYPGPPSGEIAPSFLGIITTRSCNIECCYCNFAASEVNRQHMDLGMAVKAVDWYVERILATKGDCIHIHFFGGEPLIAPDVVETVVHRARLLAVQHGLDTHIEASTNGVLSRSMREFVAEYFDSIVLSLDGPEQYQNRNRPGIGGLPTSDRVNKAAQFFRKSSVEVCIRLCVTHESVEELAEITRWVCEQFEPNVVNYETLTPGSLSQKAGLYPPDPYVFAKACVQAYQVAYQYGVKPIYSAADTTYPRHSFCPVGTDAAIVSLDGRVSGCYLLPEEWQQRGLDLDFGIITNNGSCHIKNDDVLRVRSIPQDKTRCEQCFCQWSCSGGCHVNQTYPGSSEKYTDFCLQTRLVTACLLLDEMGMSSQALDLLADSEACSRLAEQVNDGVWV